MPVNATITIDGTGKLTATGGWSAAGIGGGDSGAGGTIKIDSSATVKASSGGPKAAIDCLDGTTVTSTDGSKTAANILIANYVGEVYSTVDVPIKTEVRDASGVSFTPDAIEFAPTKEYKSIAFTVPTADTNCTVFIGDKQQTHSTDTEGSGIFNVNQRGLTSFTGVRNLNAVTRYDISKGSIYIVNDSNSLEISYDDENGNEQRESGLPVDTKLTVFGETTSNCIMIDYENPSEQSQPVNLCLENVTIDLSEFDQQPISPLMVSSSHSSRSSNENMGKTKINLYLKGTNTLKAGLFTPAIPVITDCELNIFTQESETTANLECTAGSAAPAIGGSVSLLFGGSRSARTPLEEGMSYYTSMGKVVLNSGVNLTTIGGNCHTASHITANASPAIGGFSETTIGGELGITLSAGNSGTIIVKDGATVTTTNGNGGDISKMGMSAINTNGKALKFDVGDGYYFTSTKDVNNDGITGVIANSDTPTDIAISEQMGSNMPENVTLTKGAYSKTSSEITDTLTLAEEYNTNSNFVTYTLQNLIATVKPTIVGNGDNLSATLSANSGYMLPNKAITVKIGGNVLTAGTDYTYTQSTGVITVSSVTGDVEIIANGAKEAVTSETAPSNPLTPDNDPVITAKPEGTGKLFRTVTEPLTSEQVKTAEAQIATPSNAVKEFEDVELQISDDSGTSWRKATTTEIEGGKASVFMPLPSGTSSATHTFKIYHFADASGVDGTATPLDTTVENGIAAAKVEVSSFSPFAIVATPKQAGGNGGGSSHGSDNRDDREYDFWNDVKSAIKKSQNGDVVKVNAKSYDKMPLAVMEELRNNSVALVIDWNGGNTITIPTDKAQPSESGRIYYPLSLLAQLYEKYDFIEGLVKIEKADDAENIAPVTSNGNYISVVNDKPIPITGGVLKMEAANTENVEPISITPPTEGIGRVMEATPQNGNNLICFVIISVSSVAGVVLVWRKKKEY